MRRAQWLLGHYYKQLWEENLAQLPEIPVRKSHFSFQESNRRVTILLVSHS